MGMLSQRIGILEGLGTHDLIETRLPCATFCCPSTSQGMDANIIANKLKNISK